jgi:hypothetical protein
MEDRALKLKKRIRDRGLKATEVKAETKLSIDTIRKLGSPHASMTDETLDEIEGAIDRATRTKLHSLQRAVG